MVATVVVGGARAVKQSTFWPITAKVIQKDGAKTISKVCIAPGNCSCMHTTLVKLRMPWSHSMWLEDFPNLSREGWLACKQLGHLCSPRNHHRQFPSDHQHRLLHVPLYQWCHQRAWFPHPHKLAGKQAPCQTDGHSRHHPHCNP